MISVVAVCGARKGLHKDRSGKQTINGKKQRTELHQLGLPRFLMRFCISAHGEEAFFLGRVGLTWLGKHLSVQVPPRFWGLPAELSFFFYGGGQGRKVLTQDWSVQCQRAQKNNCEPNFVQILALCSTPPCTSQLKSFDVCKILWMDLKRRAG